jgi:NAD(P)-dependent dehydrogenase (short-subunit alcohol dehydrogenase family)
MVQSRTARRAFQSPYHLTHRTAAQAAAANVAARGSIPNADTDRRGRRQSSSWIDFAPPMCALPHSTARLRRTHFQALGDVPEQTRLHDMTKLEWKDRRDHRRRYGIGRAAAKRFIEEGAFVFIFGRRQEALDAAVAELGPNARAVKGSVSDEADLDRLYAAVKAERGTLDIVFANAGAGSQLALGEITAEHIDETFDTNVKGTIFTVQKALPLMGQGGSIILTGSSAGTTGAPAFSAYSASKAAVRNLARTWAEDLKGTGIRVNVLSPGATATELAKEALGEEGQKVFAAMTPLQRMADPAEIAAAAAFLASSDSSFMTASEVAVDGGLAQI